MKKSKHRTYDDPSAFRQQFPRIVEVTDGSMSTVVNTVMTTKIFTMGKCKVILHEADEKRGWFMSVRRNDRYPSWDEIVWLRYSLIPDGVVMSLLLPNLNSYINLEGNDYQNVFTMEQQGWSLDPSPKCCEKEMVLRPGSQTNTAGVFDCATCGKALPVEFKDWNEQHGNGLKGIRA